MAMITGNINLGALKHVKMKAKGKTGDVDGMFIPFAANNLAVGEKGGIYLNTVNFQMKEPKDYGTHITKQSLSKEKRESMSKEELDAMPILGNLNVDNSPPETSNDAGGGASFAQEDEVPF